MPNTSNESAVAAGFLVICGETTPDLVPHLFKKRGFYVSQTVQDAT